MCVKTVKMLEYDFDNVIDTSRKIVVLSVLLH